MAEAVFGGWYIETRLNEYYLSCRLMNYQKEHNCHINLITGLRIGQKAYCASKPGRQASNRGVVNDVEHFYHNSDILHPADNSY